MRVGIEAGWLALAPSPRNREANSTVCMLADLYPDSDFLLYTPRLKKGSLSPEMQRFHNIRVCLPAQSGFKGVLWQLFGVTNNLAPDKVDIFHGFDGRLPLNIRESGVPTVLSVSHVEDKPSSLLDRISQKICRKSCVNADLILIPDERVKQLICNFFVISPNKIEAAPAAFAGGSVAAKFLMKKYEDTLEAYSPEVKN